MTVREELLSATDAVIDDAMLYADPMVLRGLLYQLTGDEEMRAIETPAVGAGSAYSAGGITMVANEDDVCKLRARAGAFLKAYRDAGAGEIGLGPASRLLDSLTLTAGEAIPEAEIPMWMETPAFDPFVRGIDWKGAPPPREKCEAFRVGVIGSGLSGLGAAVLLDRAGIPFQVLEKNDDVGGCWYENSYPGARVDSPSRSYTHLFGIDFPYPYNYCPRDENMKYFRWVADHFGVRDRIAFNTEVKKMVWNEAEQVWDVTADTPTGSRTWKFNAVISCVGFLSRPNLPRIPGMESFAGVATHTAQWPAGLDVTGKRVAVIGSGASGYQTTPELAKLAGHLHLFQRTPSWCYDNEMYVKPLPEQSVWLDRNFPYYVNFAKFRLSWLSGPDNVEYAARIDPNYSGDPDARSAGNKASRDARIAFLTKKLASRPELIEKMIPPAPPMSSRPIQIDTEDSIFDALLRGNVTLVTDPIERITSKGIVVGGEEIPLDVIVYATGFKANDFLWPMEVIGRGGQRVEDLWAKDGARSYICSMMPGFPNMFMSYGPNGNNFGGFQVIDLLEIVIRFALRSIAGLIEQDRRSVDVTTEAYWRFNAELDKAEARMIYMDPRVKNYYRNEHGRSAVNGPVDFRRMWNWLLDPTRPVPEETDAGLKPYFGEDLLVS